MFLVYLPLPTARAVWLLCGTFYGCVWLHMFAHSITEEFYDVHTTVCARAVCTWLNRFPSFFVTECRYFSPADPLSAWLLQFPPADNGASYVEITYWNLAKCTWLMCTEELAKEMPLLLLFIGLFTSRIHSPLALWQLCRAPSDPCEPSVNKAGREDDWLIYLPVKNYIKFTKSSAILTVKATVAHGLSYFISNESGRIHMNLHFSWILQPSKTLQSWTVPHRTGCCRLAEKGQQKIF